MHLYIQWCDTRKIFPILSVLGGKQSTKQNSAALEAVDGRSLLREEDRIRLYGRVSWQPD